MKAADSLVHTSFICPKIPQKLVSQLAASGVSITPRKAPIYDLGLCPRVKKSFVESRQLGSVLAVGSRGIHALQVVSEDVGRKPIGVGWLSERLAHNRAPCPLRCLRSRL